MSDHGWLCPTCNRRDTDSGVYDAQEIERLTARIAELEAERDRLASELAEQASRETAWSNKFEDQLRHFGVLLYNLRRRLLLKWRADRKHLTGKLRWLQIEYDRLESLSAAQDRAIEAQARDMAEAKRYTQEVKEAITPLGLHDSEWIPSAIKRAVRELAEARKDTERLDWLEKQMDEWRYHADFAIQSDEEDGVWFARITRHDCGELRGIPLEDGKAETVRAALDAARTGGNNAE